jgi:hypothetical protein
VSCASGTYIETERGIEMADSAILELETKDISQVDVEETKDVEQQIRERAYELFLERGLEHGSDVEDWLKAEAEITAKIDSR